MPSNQMAAAYQICSAELRALKLCPLDDAVNEGPHVQAARIAHHARSTTRPWVASTQRLAQNLADITELPMQRGLAATVARIQHGDPG